jgi:hypothetical protein
LSYTTIPFCFRYFSNRVSSLCLSDPPFCASPSSWDETHHHAQFFIGWDEVSLTFLLGLAWHLNPPDFYLPSS